MAGLLPAHVYGLRVPAGSFLPTAAAQNFPATFRITMAAIDPSATPLLEDGQTVPRATLKLLRERDESESDDEDWEDEDDEDDIEAIKARLSGVISESDSDASEDEDSEVEANGGPSDPAKAKKALKAALIKKLKEEAEAMDIDEAPNGVNGTKTKGKGKAAADDSSELDDEDEDEDDEEDGDAIEELVICTLDPNGHYQQPLDITIGEHEDVYFQVSGTHDIYLTGNYVLPPDDMGGEDDEDSDDYDSEEMDFNMPQNADEEMDDDLSDEDDALDGIPDPRITELHSDEEEPPKLVTAAAKKGKNKRPAESDDEAATLDELISKTVKSEAPATNGEKLSKKQAKKLKKNDGQAVAAAEDSTKKEAPNSDKKKVQFAKNLELGPTGSPKVEDTKKEVKKETPTKKEAPKAEAPKEANKTGPRNVNGVTIEDKKTGKGRAAKKGDRIEMRYIGKLKNGKQFDSNKKGKPFSFKLGTGEVIKGWDIGVVGMTAGGERRLTIPAKLAYGNKALPDIPANSELIFDIKCISIS